MLTKFATVFFLCATVWILFLHLVLCLYCITTDCWLGLNPRGLFFPWPLNQAWWSMKWKSPCSAALNPTVSVRQWPLTACVFWCLLGQCGNSSGGTWWRVCWYTPIHTRTDTRTCISVDVNRKWDKSALVALHVIPQQKPDAGLTLDPAALTWILPFLSF